MDDKTVLVIGGTGMLRQATLWLIERCRSTLVVARRASRFSTQDGRVIALDADWNDPAFESRVGAAIEASGPISDALLWLHNPEPVLTWLLPLLPGTRIVLVLGSSDGRPKSIEAAANVATVRLGSMPADGGRRWLTHAEISAAAIEALESLQSGIAGELAEVR